MYIPTYHLALHVHGPRFTTPYKKTLTIVKIKNVNHYNRFLPVRCTKLTLTLNGFYLIVMQLRNIYLGLHDNFD